MKQIPLTQGQFAIVDDADYDWLNQYKWCADKTGCGGYRATRGFWRNGKCTKVYMHRQIMNAPVGMDVDHRDHNTLDNQRHNLRVCTHAENGYNQASKTGTSRFKGVSWHKQPGKWEAYIQVDGKQRYLGLFTDEVEAAETYDKAARELFGEFAYCNFRIT